jgi:transcriptional regulator with XRE-family HTH domain
MAQSSTISGSELRARIDKLGLTYTDAARRLGLSLDGLQKQMRGARPVSLQTEIILDQIEELQKLRRPGELGHPTGP